MSDPATSFQDVVSVATPILVFALIIFQLLDRRDKKTRDITKPINEIKDFITEKFHEGELRMQTIEAKIEANRNGVSSNKEELNTVRREQAAVRQDTGRILEKMATALKSDTRRRRRKDESDDGM